MYHFIVYVYEPDEDEYYFIYKANSIEEACDDMNLIFPLGTFTVYSY